MTSVAGLLDGSRRPGVYRALGEPEPVAAALRSAGWVVGTAAATAGRAAFYREVAAALGFPGYFGANLDALWDSLTDLVAPTALVVTGWATLARTEPETWQRLLAVFRERSQTDPEFALVLL